ncbi:MAG: hypothetical protein H0W88_08100 [Parachlamydiaceae bacterium]|nr:hypothetical protein [Parachlamydiaceae bacterium]
MHDLSSIEEYFKKYSKSLYYWIPEGIYTVNISLLQRFNLLHFQFPPEPDPVLTRQFYILESPEKITLINDDFVIWIMPDKIDQIPVTYALIAINHEDQPRLEVAFIASGVYNTSHVVLRVLDKFLLEIQENEKLLDKLSFSA